MTSAAHLGGSLEAGAGYDSAPYLDASGHPGPEAFAGFDDLLRMLAHLPSSAWDVGGAAVEEVLSVLQVEHGVGLLRMLAVAGRQVDDHVALVGQELALESAMETQAWMEMHGRLGPRGAPR